MATHKFIVSSAAELIAAAKLQALLERHGVEDVLTACRTGGLRG